MASGFACYHHCNDLDRPAVSPCSKCGKSLCVECTDLFRSKKTGNILCIECLNKEIKGNENRFAAISARLKSEMNKMIVGLVVGIIAAIILLVALEGAAKILGIWMPFLFASFGLIWEKSFGSCGWLIGAIVFVVLVLVSPIMFIVRLKSRSDRRKSLAYMIQVNMRAREMNNQFLEKARKKKSGLTAAEMQKLVFQITNAKNEMQNLSSSIANERRALEQAQASGNQALVEQLTAKIGDLEAKQANLDKEHQALNERMNESDEKNDEQYQKLTAELSGANEALFAVTEKLDAESKPKTRKSA